MNPEFKFKVGDLVSINRDPSAIDVVVDEVEDNYNGFLYFVLVTHPDKEAPIIRAFWGYLLTALRRDSETRA